MKHLKKNTKRVLSLGLALLMVVSTMFVGGIQAKAETGTTYAPYYDVETEKVVGAPEVGTVLMPDDIISKSLAGDASIEFVAYPFKEQAENEDENALLRGAYSGIGTAETEKRVKHISVDFADVSNGLVVHEVNYSEKTYSDGTEKTIEIVLYPNEEPTKVDSLALDFDWSKLDFVVGEEYEGSVPDEFIKSPYVDATSEDSELFKYMLVKNGENWEPIFTHVIKADETYAIEFFLEPTAGYYFIEDTDVTTVDNGTSVNFAHFTSDMADGIADYSCVQVVLGTGAEIAERVADAKEPSTPVVPPVEDDGDNDPVVPPVEDDEEEAKLELRPNGQAGPQNMKHELSVDTFRSAIMEIFEDYTVGQWQSTIEKGEEANPFATGTAKYVEGGMRAGLNVASGDTAYISVVKINDKTQADMIGKSFENMEHYAQFENKYYLYNEGEYVVYISVPEKQSKAGLTMELIKSYLDAYYEFTIAENDYTAKLENEAEIAEKVELSELEKTYMELTGEELEIILDFKEVGSEAVTEEQKAIVKELGDKKVGTFLEIDLTKKIGTYEAKVSETTGAVAITFELPADLKNTDTKVERTYYVVRYHDGKVDILDATYDEATGKITFETDKFSTYAVVYEDVAVKEPVKAPATGDTTNVAMYIMLLVCGAGILVASRKMNRI